MKHNNYTSQKKFSTFLHQAFFKALHSFFLLSDLERVEHFSGFGWNNRVTQRANQPKFILLLSSG